MPTRKLHQGKKNSSQNRTNITQLSQCGIRFERTEMGACLWNFLGEHKAILEPMSWVMYRMTFTSRLEMQQPRPCHQHSALSLRLIATSQCRRYTTLACFGSSFAAAFSCLLWWYWLKIHMGWKSVQKKSSIIHYSSPPCFRWWIVVITWRERGREVISRRAYIPLQDFRHE